MNPNGFDKQANTLDRLRRSMQRLGKGGIISTIPVAAPLSNTGSTIGFAAQGSLTVLAGPSSGAAATPTFRALTSTDLPDLAYVDSVSAADASLLVSGASDTPALKVQLSSTSGTTNLISTDFSALAANTQVGTINGTASTWYVSDSGSNVLPSVTSNTTHLTVQGANAPRLVGGSTTTALSYSALWVSTALGLNSTTNYSIFANVTAGGAVGGGTSGVVGIFARADTTGTHASNQGIIAEIWNDSIAMQDMNSGTTLIFVSSTVGAGNHLMELRVAGNNFSLFVDNVQIGTTHAKTTDSANTGVGFFCGKFVNSGTAGVKTFALATTATPSYSGLSTTTLGLEFLPDPNGGLVVGSTGVGIHGVSTVASDPSTPADGDVWYNSTAKALRRRDGGVTLGNVGLASALTADSAVVSNTTAATMTASTVTLGANVFTVGKSVRIKWGGFYSTVGTPALTVLLYSNFGQANSTGIDGTTFTADNNAAGQRYFGEIVLTCQTVGATGHFTGAGYEGGEFGGGNAFQALGGEPFVIDTTNPIYFAVVITWGTASASNATRLRSFTLEVMDPPS